MDIPVLLFTILSGLYFLLLIAVWYAFGRLKTPSLNHQPRVSVVVAARNEAQRIGPCLESLQNLDYPQDKYEIIIIDDNSSDGTGKIIEQACAGKANWRCLVLDEKSRELHGKKNALLQAIAMSTGELIFTTDADCIVPPRWLTRMVNYFQPGVSMVLGYSPLITKSGFLQRLLAFDNLFSAISAAAPTKLGYPFTSVGRNLAYRRDAYENAGGFLALKKFKSGDDVHMTERFRYLNNGRIDYCAHPDTFIHTQPPDTAKEIFHQQIRKNSKTLKKQPSSIAFSLILFIYFIAAGFLPVFIPQAFTLWAVLLVIKLVLEFIPLRKAAIVFNQRGLIKWVPLMQIIYPAYIIFFSILGALQLYQWKK